MAGSVLPHWGSGSFLGAKRPLASGTEMRGEQFGGHRMPDKESLGEVASESLEPAQLAAGLDPFGHDRETERTGQADDGFNDGRVLTVAVEAGHEAAVDLQELH